MSQCLSILYIYIYINCAKAGCLAMYGPRTETNLYIILMVDFSFIPPGPGALLVLAPPCSSWSRVSRGSSMRSRINPLGIPFDFVEAANQTISRLPVSWDVEVFSSLGHLKIGLPHILLLCAGVFFCSSWQSCDFVLGCWSNLRGRQMCYHTIPD